MGTYGTLFAKARELANEGMPLDQAMAEASRFFYSSGPVVTTDAQGNRNPVDNPTGEQLQQALNEYLPTLNRMARYVVPQFSPEVMKQRYDYSVKCMEVMQQIVREHVQRAVIFDETAKQLFREDFGAEVLNQVHPRRWFENLLRLDDTPEAKAHNELVVSLVMLGESYARNDREAGDARFRRVRLDYYQNTMGMSQHDAELAVIDEVDYGLQKLVDLTEEAMEHNPTLEQSDAARDAILSGAAENEPGGLERAYRTIMNPGSAIAWNIANACDDFNSFGMNVNKADFRKYEMDSSSVHDCVIQHVANPFYAILDAAELVNAGASGLPPRRGDPPQNNAAQSYGGDLFNGLYQSREDYALKALPRFALTASNSAGVRNQPNDIKIYSDRKGHTVIVACDPVDLSDGLILGNHLDMPGRLLSSAGYSDKIEELLKKSTEKDRFMRSSGQYRDLKRALNAMPKQIPDNLSVQEARELERKFADLKKAARAYLKRKDDQFAERGTTEGKDDYEKTRYAFAKAALDFTDEMDTRVKFIREHTETMEKVLAVEAEDARNPIPGDPNLPPYARKVQNEKDEIERQKLAEESEKARQESEKARQEREAQLNAGDIIDLAMGGEEILPENDAMNESSEELIGGNGITAAEKRLRNKLMNDGEELKQGDFLKLYILESQMAYADALENGNAMQIKSCAADLLAAKAAEQFIEYGKTAAPELAERFQAAADSGVIDETIDGKIIVVNGKVKELVEGIKTLPKFEERLSKANPGDPNQFGEAIEKTAISVGKDAVLSVQAAQRVREEAEIRRQSNPMHRDMMDDSLSEEVVPDESIGLDESIGEGIGVLKELLAKNEAANQQPKAVEQPKAEEQPKAKEPLKVEEPPKVKGGIKI